MTTATLFLDCWTLSTVASCVGGHGTKNRRLTAGHERVKNVYLLKVVYIVPCLFVFTQKRSGYFNKRGYNLAWLTPD